MSLAGVPTIAETRDLVAQKDYLIAQVKTKFEQSSDAWAKKDPNELGTWAGDWGGLLSRYASARSVAEASFATSVLSPLPDELTPDPEGWSAVLRAVKQVDGVVTRGDLQDLITRMFNAGFPPDLSKNPQPTATDADLTLYKGADMTLKAVSSVGFSVGGGLLVAGGLALVLVLLTRR